MTPVLVILHNESMSTEQSATALIQWSEQLAELLHACALIGPRMARACDRWMLRRSYGHLIWCSENMYVVSEQLYGRLLEDDMGIAPVEGESWGTDNRVKAPWAADSYVLKEEPPRANAELAAWLLQQASIVEGIARDLAPMTSRLEQSRHRTSLRRERAKLPEVVIMLRLVASHLQGQELDDLGGYRGTAHEI